VRDNLFPRADDSPVDPRPVIGITCEPGETDAAPGKRANYVKSIREAGGEPRLLPPPAGFAKLADSKARAKANEAFAACDAVVFSGGRDIDPTRRGEPPHPKAKLLDQDRQRFEEVLLELLDQNRSMPVLGVCLGMQHMAWHRGGHVRQHMDDAGLRAHTAEKGDATHDVVPVDGCKTLKPGPVASHHHQDVDDPGPRLRVIARSADGGIEAVDDPSRPFYVGVQWHPERTKDERTGLDVYRALVDAARRTKSR